MNDGQIEKYMKESKKEKMLAVWNNFHRLYFHIPKLPLEEQAAVGELINKFHDYANKETLSTDDIVAMETLVGEMGEKFRSILNFDGLGELLAYLEGKEPSLSDLYPDKSNPFDPTANMKPEPGTEIIKRLVQDCKNQQDASAQIKAKFEPLGYSVKFFSTDGARQMAAALLYPVDGKTLIPAFLVLDCEGIMNVIQFREVSHSLRSTLREQIETDFSDKENAGKKMKPEERNDWAASNLPWKK